jgi:hypothetical protein
MLIQHQERQKNGQTNFCENIFTDKSTQSDTNLIAPQGMINKMKEQIKNGIVVKISRCFLIFRSE